jgi:hypothetical protein
VITVDNNSSDTITLVGVHSSALHASDFHFAWPDLILCFRREAARRDMSIASLIRAYAPEVPDSSSLYCHLISENNQEPP